MATVTVESNRNRSYRGSGSWQTDGSRCGFQGGSSTTYRWHGEMRFPSPAIGTNTKVTSLAIYMYATSVGGVYDKTFGIMWGSATGSPYYWFTASSFYKKGRTSYPAVGGDFFNNLANAVKYSGNITIGMYNSSVNHYSSDKGYDYNYCNVTYATLSVTYEVIPNIKYYDGTDWKTIIPYYYDGTSWQKCQAKYYNGTSWITC